MRKPDAFEKQHMGRVAELGCVLCQHLGYGPTPANVHHIREGAGMGQRSPHYLTVPLCKPHHQGNEGYMDLVCAASTRATSCTNWICFQ